MCALDQFPDRWFWFHAQSVARSQAFLVHRHSSGRRMQSLFPGNSNAGICWKRLLIIALACPVRWLCRSDRRCPWCWPRSMLDNWFQSELVAVQRVLRLYSGKSAKAPSRLILLYRQLPRTWNPFFSPYRQWVQILATQWSVAPVVEADEWLFRRYVIIHVLIYEETARKLTVGCSRCTGITTAHIGRLRRMPRAHSTPRSLNTYNIYLYSDKKAKNTVT